MTFSTTVRSDVVAVDYYDIETKEHLEEISTAFAIHKPTTSIVSVEGVETPASNALAVLDHIRINGSSTDDIVQDEAIVVGVYPNYMSQFSVPYKKLVPPCHLSVSSFASSSNDYREMALFDMTGNLTYMSYYDMPLTILMGEYKGKDLFLNQSVNKDTKNIQRLDLFQGNLTFIFCGLIYEFDSNGALVCQNGNTLLPSALDLDINHFVRLPNPTAIDTVYDTKIPLKIYVKERGNLDYSPQDNVDPLNERDFKRKYPQYSSVLNYLSNVVSMSFMGKENAEEEVERITNDHAYLFPDVKFLQSGTDISAASKLVSFGPDTDGGFSAWFGVPTARNMILNEQGFKNISPDPEGAYPNGHGISSDGVGAGIALFSKEQDVPYSDPTLAQAVLDAENGDTEAGIRFNHIETLTAAPIQDDPPKDDTAPIVVAIFGGSAFSIGRPSSISSTVKMNIVYNSRLVFGGNYAYVSYNRRGRPAISGAQALPSGIANVATAALGNPGEGLAYIELDGTTITLKDIRGASLVSDTQGTTREAHALHGLQFIEKIDNTYYLSSYDETLKEYVKGEAIPVPSNIDDTYPILKINGGFLYRSDATTAHFIREDTFQLVDSFDINLPSGSGQWFSTFR